ncbi:MAG: hypothetical protein JXX29_03625 [Deltaproteobacteria bacterium]|nr:hypothetical protein [Deltaproteobacteria bacterium]MBN2670733.1 hypothetical protein [Deltaproteobacteria bacterium]
MRHIALNTGLNMVSHALRWMHPFRVFVFAGIFLGAPNAVGQIIDDFEGDSPLSAWTFFNGGEFPGAMGSIAVGQGMEGQGAVLTYDFTQGGRYVQISRTLQNVSAEDTLLMYIQADILTQLTFRVTDATGQTIQYRPNLTFEAIACETWCPLLFSSNTTRLDYWGGAEDGVLHDSIVSFAILASISDYAPLAGDIGIDNLQRLSTETFSIDPEVLGTSLSAASENFFDRFCVAAHQMADETALDALQSLGVRWVRTDMWWNSVETEVGVYNFSQWDAELQSLEERGMGAVFLLNYGNDLYGGGPPTSAIALDAYGAYAQAAAAYFVGRPVIFEVWNEPDGPNFWPPDGNQPLEYATLLDLAIDRIRGGDPNAQISTGGIS